MSDVLRRRSNGLAICAGIGGLELGLQLSIGDAYQCVCYIERDPFAAATLVARMGDQALDRAPIWDDLTTFDGSAWRGVVDIVSAGFPCQPWSYAGRRQGTADDRWLWPEIARIIRDVGTSVVFLENVPGLLSGGLGHVLGDLATIGFDAEWDVFSAAGVGASHLRKRLFVLAYSDSRRLQEFNSRPVKAPRYDVNGCCSESLANSNDDRTRAARPNEFSSQSSTLADTGRVSVDALEPLAERQRSNTTESSETVAITNSDSHRWNRCSHTPWLTFPPAPNDTHVWLDAINRGLPEPAIRRVANGIPNRLDSLRTLGNGVVALEAAYAFRTLAARIR